MTEFSPQVQQALDNLAVSIARDNVALDRLAPSGSDQFRRTLRYGTSKESDNAKPQWWVEEAGRWRNVYKDAHINGDTTREARAQQAITICIAKTMSKVNGN